MHAHIFSRIFLVAGFISDSNLSCTSSMSLCQEIENNTKYNRACSRAIFCNKCTDSEFHRTSVLRRFHFICFQCQIGYKQYVPYNVVENWSCSIEINNNFDPTNTHEESYDERKGDPPEYKVKHKLLSPCHCFYSQDELNTLCENILCSKCNHPLFIAGFNFRVPKASNKRQWNICKEILLNLEYYFNKHFHKYKRFYCGYIFRGIRFDDFRSDYMSECMNQQKDVYIHIPFPNLMEEIDEYMELVVRRFCCGYNEEKFYEIEKKNRRKEIENKKRRK